MNENTNRPKFKYSSNDFPVLLGAPDLYESERGNGKAHVGTVQSEKGIVETPLC